MYNASVRFDTQKIKEGLIKYFTKVFEKFAETAILYIQSEIPSGTSTEWPKVWRDQAKDIFKLLSIEVSNNIIIGKVGPVYSDAARDEAVLRVLEYGTGIIETKPGQETWGKYMDSRVPPNYELDSYRIPQFEHPGIGFFENAMKRLKVRFDAEIEQAVMNIPTKIFTDSMITK